MATIVFSHANGFPAGCYRQVFEAWRAAGHRVLALDKLGHDPRYPVTSNWPNLREQLLHFVEHETAGEPVHFVGHSLGGFVSLLAALRRPELARGVVLLDSPVLYGWKAHSVGLFKATGWIRHVSPGRVSQRRREHFASPEEALAHYRAKPAFARWAPGVLEDYVACGFEPAGGRQCLSFRREVETDIYNTLPHHWTRLLRRHPPACPVAFVGGTSSVEVRQVGMRATGEITRGRVSWIEGGHLFPFERPQETAQAVLGWLQAFEQAPRGAAAAAA
ncbi:alpha/beta fold hydrolase [Caldimonas tepidiphila]|uniref:alpha/beta fold hydrolase n=1 Tax=Caldimonas tepidiphila TaxID=2315841 RepID=UPI000E5C2270|nr:alpha/beta hydrolase [Caldimonas tepidiphila]